MNQQRTDRVAEAIKRVIGELIQHGRIKDVRISGLISVTGVEVSGDLRHAKVYISVYGDEDTQEQTMEGLQSAIGFIRSEVGKQIKLRCTPDLHLKLDHSMQRGAEINELLRRIQREKEEQEHEDGSSEPS